VFGFKQNIYLIIFVKILKLNICDENFPFPKKRYYFFIKYFLEKKSSLSPCHKRQKQKKQKIRPNAFLQPHHPTPPKK